MKKTPEQLRVEKYKADVEYLKRKHGDNVVIGSGIPPKFNKDKKPAK